MLWAAFILLAFASGSIPFGLIIARAHGVDIRKVGSGNIGATNVLRTLGPRAGFVCLGLDALKGLVPTLAAGLATGSAGAFPISRTRTTLWLLVIVAAIFGHTFSPWIGFRGGKGVATGFGALLGFWPYLTLPVVGALAVFVAIAWAWRYIGFASCVAATSLPLWLWVGGRAARATIYADKPPDQFAAHTAGLTPLYVGVTLLALLVIYKHRGNLKRMVAGTENRLSFKPKAPTPRAPG